MKKSSKKPLDLEAAISALPDRVKHNWTPEIDRLLLKWCPIKGVPAVAAILRIPRPTVDARYQKLKAEGE